MGLRSQCGNSSADSAVDQYLLECAAAADDQNNGSCRSQTFTCKAGDLFLLEAACKTEREEGEDG
ncbi:hypothetical protein D3C81_2214220 [compost metagenome]